MTLSLPERFAMLMPPSVFYRRRIAHEARTGEPELAVLAELVPRGGVDVGANVGFFAYALVDIADRVLSFEPNPDYALFARAKHPIVAIKRKPQTCRGFQTGDLRETPRARCPRRPPILSQSTNQARRGSKRRA